MAHDSNHLAFTRSAATFSTSLAFGSLRAPLRGACTI
jgi:hypothetical protein